MRHLYIGYNDWLSLKKWGQSVKVRNLPYPFLRGQPLKTFFYSKLCTKACLRLKNDFKLIRLLSTCFRNLKSFFMNENRRRTLQTHNRDILNILLTSSSRSVNRGYYTVARRYKFYVRVARTISHEWAKRTNEILFLPREHKIHILSQV